MGSIPWDAMFHKAAEARERAHAPYSKFRVGAAALYADGSIAVGCNVENASYGLTLCAERAAIARGVADGRSGLQAVAIVADSKDPCPPCGMCRQVMAEFAGPELWVRSRNLQGGEQELQLGTLLPAAFTKAALE